MGTGGYVKSNDTDAQAVIEGHASKSPEIMLAQHVNEAFGTRIPADDLKKFLVENWWTVQRLAHEIHDRQVDQNRALARLPVLRVDLAND